MRLAIAAVALVLLPACSVTSIPLESAWYLQARNVSESAQIQIALLNRSERELRITEVFLNNNRDEQNRTLRLGHGKGFSILPGQMVVLPLSGFEASEKHTSSCIIPVSLAVKVSEDTRTWLQQQYGRLAGEEDGRLRVDLLGRMPSALPEHWNCSVLGR